jgi:signal peptidase I
MDFDLEEQVLERQKLMKKSPLLIISFFLFLLIDIILFIILQKNPLFMFNLNRSDDNMPNPLLTDIFTTVFYTIILVAIIVYIIYLIVCLKKTYLSNYPVYKKIHTVADFFSIVPIFLFIIIVINGLFFSIAQVDGESMEPTFCNYDTVIISYNNELLRNDILIIKYQENFLIKRVVGLPGDKLKVSDSGVYINDQLIEGYIPNSTIEYEMTIPEGQYYVLGDNRFHSLDSRVIGLIGEEEVLGEVVSNLTNGVCPQ